MKNVPPEPIVIKQKSQWKVYNAFYEFLVTEFLGVPQTIQNVGILK